MGTRLEVRVGGSFSCPPTDGLDGIRRIVLVAGGVGINPLMSILGYIADETDRLKLEVSVMYGVKVPEDGNLDKILFLDRIVDLFRRGRLTGKVGLFLTGPIPQGGDLHGGKTDAVDIKHGRMTKDAVLAAVRAGGDKKSTLVYVCGPPVMTDYFVDTLTAPEIHGVIDPARVKSEKWW